MKNILAENMRRFSTKNLNKSAETGLNEYGEDEFDRSPEMYSRGKSPRDGGNDFDKTGLIVTGRTQRDNNAIGDLLDGLGLHAEWDSRTGHWWFPESPDAYDELERILDAEFAQHNISARFEGI
jgi:hypothetical protein